MKNKPANTDKICGVVLGFTLLTDKGTDCVPATAPFWIFGSQPHSLLMDGVMQSGSACFPLYKRDDVLDKSTDRLHG